MAAEGLRGVVRGQRHRTTIADTTAEYVQDWMQRQCHAERPNQLWVADFTCVSDVFERRVVGWCRALARQRRRRL